jgi:methylated-DNA-[protein]-cysteine S-methyltransferase
MSIPYGETRTYGQVAQMAGIPNGARVVGHTMATNPCLILIPCHRVLLANGKLGHFSAPGGAQTRANLLTFEGYYLAL